MKNAMRSATPHYTWIQGCYWMVYCILLSFSSVYLLEQGLSNTEIGLLLGLSGLASALLQPVAGARAGRMRRLSLGQLSGCLVGGMGLCALGLLLLPGKWVQGGLFMVLLALLQMLAPFLYAFQIPSRDTAALRRLADLADGAVVWGGDGAVTALRQLALPGCKLMEWGHRLSFAYLSRWEGEEDALSALAEHLIQTGGLLCSSCQVIFLDTDALGEGEAFCRSFLPLLERAADRFRAALGEKGEGSLYAWETRLEHAADRLPGTLFPGRGCSLTLREDRELELSPLHGNVLVKCLPQKALLPVLRRQKGRLQTAGLLCPAQDRPALTQLLARAGVTRIAPPGSMSRTLSGEGHDGEFPLRRYVRTVDIQEPSPDRPF